MFIIARMQPKPILLRIIDFVSGVRILSKSGLPRNNRKRIRVSRALVACPCKIKVITKCGEALITRVDRDPSGHSHQLEAIEYKLPTGVRDLAANEVG